MTVLTKQMYDPDIEDRTEAKEAIDFYEWAIVDGSREAGVYKKWERVLTVQRINNTHVSYSNFRFPCNQNIYFSVKSFSVSTVYFPFYCNG